jgi:hypothetical protein
MRLEGWPRGPWFETALKKRLPTMRFPVSVTPSKPAQESRPSHPSVEIAMRDCRPTGHGWGHAAAERRQLNAKSSYLPSKLDFRASRFSR